MRHPRMEQYKHGEFLNPLPNGRFSADFFGFCLVGKLGNPETVDTRVEEAGGLPQVLEVSHEQCTDLVLTIGALQDNFDVGTPRIVEMLRDEA